MNMPGYTYVSLYCFVVPLIQLIAPPVTVLTLLSTSSDIVINC